MEIPLTKGWFTFGLIAVATLFGVCVTNGYNVAALAPPASILPVVAIQSTSVAWALNAATPHCAHVRDARMPTSIVGVAAFAIAATLWLVAHGGVPMLAVGATIAAFARAVSFPRTWLRRFGLGAIAAFAAAFQGLVSIDAGTPGGYGAYSTVRAIRPGGMAGIAVLGGFSWGVLACQQWHNAHPMRVLARASGGATVMLVIASFAFRIGGVQEGNVEEVRFSGAIWLLMQGTIATLVFMGIFVFNGMGVGYDALLCATGASIATPVAMRLYNRGDPVAPEAIWGGAGLAVVVVVYVIYAKHSTCLASRMGTPLWYCRLCETHPDPASVQWRQDEYTETGTGTEADIL